MSVRCGYDAAGSPATVSRIRTAEGRVDGRGEHQDEHDNMKPKKLNRKESGAKQRRIQKNAKGAEKASNAREPKRANEPLCPTRSRTRCACTCLATGREAILLHAALFYTGHNYKRRASLVDSFSTMRQALVYES
jgi:hypothetical protein